MKKGDIIFNTRNNKKVRVFRLVRMNVDEMEVIIKVLSCFFLLYVINLYMYFYIKMCLCIYVCICIVLIFKF